MNFLTHNIRLQQFARNQRNMYFGETYSYN